MSPFHDMFIRVNHGMRLLREDPPLFFRRVWTELSTPLVRRRSPVIRSIGHVRFEFDLSFDPAIKRMKAGVYETDIISVMRKILRPGDVFVDVGANIGYLSATALDIVGREGQVHSFEPVPQFFERLGRIRSLNPGFSFFPNQVALGERSGTAAINVSNVSNIGWNTMVPGMMSRETTLETIRIPVTTLSEYLIGRSLPSVRLIKIDTEGFEFPVVKGLAGFLHAAVVPPAIIVEVAPSAYPLLHTTLAAFSAFLDSAGYEARDIRHHDRTIDLAELQETTNVLLVPRKAWGARTDRPDSHAS